MAKIIEFYTHKMKLDKSGLRNPALQTLFWPHGLGNKNPDDFIDAEVKTKREIRAYILTDEDIDHIIEQITDPQGKKHIKEMKNVYLSNERKYQLVSMGLTNEK